MLPQGYTYLDPDEYAEQAYNLAKQEINVLSDRDVFAVIGTDDDDPEVAAVLFVGGVPGTEFTFDVVVDSDHRRKGLAKHLVRIAVDEYDQLKDAFGDDLKMKLDVINPNMRALLMSMGFKVVQSHGKKRVEMTKRESAMMEVARALTKDEKKERKKLVLHRQTVQQVKNTGVPSFEEVWDNVNEDSINDDVENAAWVPHNQDLFERETGLDYGENSEEYSDWLIQNIIMPDYKDRYDDVLHYINKYMDGDPCWRAIGFPPKGVDPATHMNLGTYWSSEESGADEYMGSNKKTLKCVYKARIDRENVDLASTVYARMSSALGEVEAEVTMIKGAKIYVYEVECGGKVIPINDWRRA